MEEIASGIPDRETTPKSAVTEPRSVKLLPVDPSVEPGAEESPIGAVDFRDASLLPRPLGLLFLGCVVVLFPWIVYLAFELPERQSAEHWDVAWVGFDIAIAIGLLLTGIWLLRRSPRVTLSAAFTGTLLICDVWFDIVTSTGVDRWISIAEAAFAELPLALVCFWIAHSVERVLEDLQPFLKEHGYVVRGRRRVVVRRP